MNVIGASSGGGLCQTNEGQAKTLIGGIWGFDPKPPLATSKLLEFCQSQITPLRPNELVVRSDQDVVDIVNFVRDRRSESPDAVEAELKRNPPAWLGLSTKAPVNLAIRLAFLVKPEQIPDKEAIGPAVQNFFPRIPAVKSGERIDHHFNERSLQKVGFNVLRTSYLSEHLLLDLPKKAVWLFEQTEFLKHYKNDGPLPIYPEGLLTETMETIKILEADDAEAQMNANLLAWNTSEGDVEMGVSKPPSMDLDNYRFWRDRLVTLHEAYRKASPTTLKQWWQDRRDSSQWTTFWLAVVAIVLTLLFGLIQSVSGIVQAVAAYRGQPCIAR